MYSIKSFLAFSSCCQFLAQATNTGNDHRELSSYYHIVTDSNELGDDNVMAAVNNPLKGLVSSPRWKNPNQYPDDIPNAIEFYYIGLDELMIGDDEYDWTVLETALDDTASRFKHTVFRVYIHYPTQVLRLPLYLIQQGVLLQEFEMFGKSEYAPYYGDEKLLAALEKFIRALGAKYDGDPRLIAIQMGLLGYWGEWHTYIDPSMLPESTMTKVTQWYKESFSTTQILARYPSQVAIDTGIGFHDDSFAYTTLVGEANGGVTHDWYFWPQIQKFNGENFWRTGLMGGETRPELQKEIFTAEYAAGTKNKQDFDLCVETTHATFMLHHNAFNTDYEGATLQNALQSIAKMGYNFKVTKVAVMKANAQSVNIDVTVEQVGVAPYYFPLNLKLECSGMTANKEVAGVEDLLGAGEFETFRFSSVPATKECLSSVSVRLVSPYVNDAERPIAFAQGVDGIVSLSLPTPEEGGNFQATASPTVSPTPAPTEPALDQEKVAEPATVEDGTCSNLISNSDMEKGISGFWATDSTLFGGLSTANLGVGGSTAIRYRKPMFGQGGFRYVGNVDVSCLTPGSVYQISAYIKLVARSGRTNTCSGNSLCPAISVSVRGTNGNIIARSVGASYDSAGEFSHYTADLVIPSDAVEASDLSIEFSGFSAIWDVVIDNFEITKE